MNPRILFILHFPPPVHGSSMVGAYIKNSSKLNNCFDCHYINLGTSRSIDEIGKGSFLKPIKYLQIILKIIYSLIKFRPNLCYLAISATGPAFYKDFFIALLLKLTGTKVVYHFHNKGVRSNQDQWPNSLLYRIVFKKAEVILLSPFLYTDVEKYIPVKRVHYCPNGIPVMETGEIPKLKKDSDEIEIVYLSNLIESKGIFDLLKAIQLLKKKNLNFHLTVVGGEGDINENIFNKKLHQLDISDRVSYVGKKFGKNKAGILSRADIFAFPTYYHNECFPLVLLEAMQFSLPLISTREGGIPDIVQDGKNGFLISQRNISELVARLEFLILNPVAAHKMGENGKQRYLENFTLEHFEERMQAILKKILSAP